MVLVGPADGGDVDLRGFASELGGIDARLHLEFVQRVDGRQERVAAVIDVRIGDAVQRVVIELLPLPADRNLGSRAAVASLARGRPVGAETGDHVRAESDQRGEVAPVERQIDDPFVIDHGAHRGIFGGQQRSASSHLDHLGDRADPELEVEAGHLLHLQLDAVANLGLQALHFRLDVIYARQQRREGIVSGAVGA